MTQAKASMVESTHSPRELWVLELMRNPEECMVVNGEPVDGPIATAKELEYVYNNGDIPMWEIDKKMADVMNRALKLARFPMANAGNKIKVNGVTSRYFLLDPSYSTAMWSDTANNRKFWKKIYTAKTKI